MQNFFVRKVSVAHDWYAALPRLELHNSYLALDQILHKQALFDTIREVHKYFYQKACYRKYKIPKEGILYKTVANGPIKIRVSLEGNNLSHGSQKGGRFEVFFRIYLHCRLCDYCCCSLSCCYHKIGPTADWSGVGQVRSQTLYFLHLNLFVILAYIGV